MGITNKTISTAHLEAYYFRWLGQKIGAYDAEVLVYGEPQTYNLLLAQLFHTKYYFSIPEDGNRCHDGKELRPIFVEEEGLPYNSQFEGAPCNVYEVLVALAMRMGDSMADLYPDKPDKWFWEMLYNTELIEFSDSFWHKNGGADGVAECISMILDRRYGRNGEGGFFPLDPDKRPRHKDQRTVELWYQMNTYLMERYYVAL